MSEKLRVANSRVILFFFEVVGLIRHSVRRDFDSMSLSYIGRVTHALKHCISNNWTFKNFQEQSNAVWLNTQVAFFQSHIIDIKTVFLAVFRTREQPTCFAANTMPFKSVC